MVMASSQHTELATAQNGQLQVNHEAALAIQNALDFVRRGQLHTLTEAIGTLQEHVVSLHNAHQCTYSSFRR